METNKKLFGNTILDHDLQIALNKLLYANIITCLETYLSDALINSILSKEIYLQKFVENFRDYQKFSFHLNEIYKIMDDLKKKVKEDLFNLMYHNLFKIKNIYKITFDINFPDNTVDVMRKVSVRHDLVHRNGKDKEGNLITITKDELNETYNLVYDFIKKIDTQLNERIA